MVKRIVSTESSAEDSIDIFSRTDVFPANVVFKGQVITFKLQKLEGGEKYKVYSECLQIRKDGSYFVDFHTYTMTLLAKMIVENPTTHGRLTPAQVHTIDEEILSQLETYIPKVGSSVSEETQHLIKKV